MKVLWVNPSFLDYRIPLYGEIDSLLNGGFHLLYSRNRVPERCHKKIKNVLGQNAHYLETEKIINIGNSHSNFANSSLSIPIPRGLYGKIRAVNPDAVIAEGYFQFTPWALCYCIFNNKPLYISYERTAYTERNCPWWRKLYRRFINCFVTGYIVNGQLTKEYLISQGVKTDTIFTGGMCADSTNLRIQSSNMTTDEVAAFNKSIGLKECKGLRYIFVGRIIELKGIDYLLKAWLNHLKTFTDDEILIVGDGDKLTEYQQQFNDESIKFLGGVDYSEIYKYYSISDIFIIPTLEDNWSLVVPEAMACGLPIACSIYNGCHPELVKQDYNGTTFDPFSLESTTQALSYFHCVNLRQMGNNSSDLELKFNPKQTASNILQMLNHNSK